MQQNKVTENQFDLYVKLSLQDAEEMPSPGVWDAIESRLNAMDAAKAPVAHGFRWDLAAAGLAMAAALATALYFTGTQTNSNLLNTSPQDRIALASPTEIEIPEIPAPEVIYTLAGTPTSQRGGRLAEQTKEEPKAAEAVATNEEPEAAVQSSEPQKPESTMARSDKQEPDAFAQMSFQDRRKQTRPRISAFIGGTVGSNEASARGAGYGASGLGTLYLQNDISEKSASNYGIPLSIGAGVRFAITDRLSIGTGLDYSFLTRSFSGSYKGGAAGDISHDMQYLGIPVQLYYNILQSKKIRFYVLGLGEAEWCLSNSYNIRNTGELLTEKVSGTQFSAGAGFGVEFKLSNVLGLYLDPVARYYFDCSQPNNIRTEKTFMLNFDAGLRFNF